jgi:hypothetical protein
MASYMNVAMTDPLSQTGLLAYDDEELQQAIPTREIFVSKVADAEHVDPHDNLFVVAFSRNCSGMRRILYRSLQQRSAHGSMVLCYIESVNKPGWQ